MESFLFTNLKPAHVQIATTVVLLEAKQIINEFADVHMEEIESDGIYCRLLLLHLS